MKHSIEFNLPEEQYLLESAMNGQMLMMNCIAFEEYLEENKSKTMTLEDIKKLFIEMTDA